MKFRASDLEFREIKAGCPELSAGFRQATHNSGQASLKSQFQFFIPDLSDLQILDRLPIVLGCLPEFCPDSLACILDSLL